MARPLPVSASAGSALPAPAHLLVNEARAPAGAVSRLRPPPLTQVAPSPGLGARGGEAVRWARAQGQGPAHALREDSGGGWRVLSHREAGAGVVPGGGGGSVAARFRAATFPSVPTPRQSALSRALLQPSAGAAAAAARAAGLAPGDRVREGGGPGACDESLNFAGVWLQLEDRGRHAGLRENPVPSGDQWLRLVPFHFISCTPLRLNASHSLESSVCPGGDESNGRRLGPHFHLAGRLTLTGGENL